MAKENKNFKSGKNSSVSKTEQVYQDNKQKQRNVATGKGAQGTKENGAKGSVPKIDATLAPPPQKKQEIK